MNIFSILNFILNKFYINVMFLLKIMWTFEKFRTVSYPNITHIFHMNFTKSMKSRFANANIYAHYSLLVFGWPCDTGTRKIRELILVLFSSLTPSPCPLSPHTTPLIDGGWYHNVGCGLCITLLFFSLSKKYVKLYYIKFL